MGVHYNANYTSVSQVKGPSGFYNIDILGNNTKQFVYVNQDYDGVLLGTATYRSAANNTNLTIGGTTDTYMWNGNISNFTIYNIQQSTHSSRNLTKLHSNPFPIRHLSS